MKRSIPSKSPIENLSHSNLSLEARGAGAGASGRVTVGVVLAGADLCAVPAEGVDGAGAVTVVAREAGFADTGAGPGVAAVISR